MRPLARAVGACLVLVTTSACDIGTHVGHDAATPACTKPSLMVVGHHQPRGRLHVAAGQTLRLHGVHYTDDCAAGAHGAGTPIAELQLVLRSKYRIGSVATVHPRGADSAFTVAVTIPATTLPGPAELTDVLQAPHGVVRLLVGR